jgi:acylphosphatase
MVRHYKIKISGKVQGVWFRQSTKAEAEKLNLNGTARNMPDGTVEIHAEGDKKDLEKLLDWCREGPDHADVNETHYNVLPLQGYEGFRVI